MSGKRSGLQQMRKTWPLRPGLPVQPRCEEGQQRRRNVRFDDQGGGDPSPPFEGTSIGRDVPAGTNRSHPDDRIRSDRASATDQGDRGVFGPGERDRNVARHWRRHLRRRSRILGADGRPRKQSHRHGRADPSGRNRGRNRPWNRAAKAARRRWLDDEQSRITALSQSSCVALTCKLLYPVGK